MACEAPEPHPECRGSPQDAQGLTGERGHCPEAPAQASVGEEPQKGMSLTGLVHLVETQLLRPWVWQSGEKTATSQAGALLPHNRDEAVLSQRQPRLLAPTASPTLPQGRGAGASCPRSLTAWGQAGSDPTGRWEGLVSRRGRARRPGWSLSGAGGRPDTTAGAWEGSTWDSSVALGPCSLRPGTGLGPGMGCGERWGGASISPEQWGIRTASSTDMASRAAHTATGSGGDGAHCSLIILLLSVRE